MQSLNDIYMFVMQQDVMTIMISLYVLIYGVAVGLKSWLTYVLYVLLKPFDRNSSYKQNLAGKILDAAWLVSVVWLCIVFFK